MRLINFVYFTTVKLKKGSIMDANTMPDMKKYCLIEAVSNRQV